MAASSSLTTRFERDVYLSFRDKDVRHFIDRLNEALPHDKIKTSIDDKLVRGEETLPSLLPAIAESKISVVVFSETYASSGWLLEELETILECRRSYGQVVIPVYYHVDRVDVENQTGSFGHGFSRVEERYKENPERLTKWRDALKEAAAISVFSADAIRTSIAAACSCCNCCRLPRQQPDDGLVKDIVIDILKNLAKQLLRKLLYMLHVTLISESESQVEEVEMHDWVSESESHGSDSEFESHYLRSKYDLMNGQIGGVSESRKSGGDFESESKLQRLRRFKYKSRVERVDMSGSSADAIRPDELVEDSFEDGKLPDTSPECEPIGGVSESRKSGGASDWDFLSDIRARIQSLVLSSKYESQDRRFLSAFFLLMETISVVLDKYGKSNKNFLLAAFVLSDIGFIMTICAFFRKRGTAAYNNKDAVRELAWVEVAFSVLACGISLSQYILAVARVKDSYSPSLYPLVFALVIAVFAFMEQMSHSQMPDSKEGLGKHASTSKALL